MSTSNSSNRKTAINRFRKNLYLQNVFPIDEADFYMSEWGKWLERIQVGKEKELYWVNNQIVDSSDTDLDHFAEEVTNAERLSNDMYAAIMVHTWSRFEKVFLNCVKAWNIEATSPVRPDVHKISEVASAFSNNIGIPLNSIPCHEYANGVRLLSNSYKHNNGRYKPGTDRFPLALSLMGQWQITVNRKIDYLNLPIKEIVLSCGTFSKELIERVKQSLTSPH